MSRVTDIMLERYLADDLSPAESAEMEREAQVGRSSGSAWSI